MGRIIIGRSNIKKTERKPASTHPIEKSVVRSLARSENGFLFQSDSFNRLLAANDDDDDAHCPRSEAGRHMATISTLDGTVIVVVYIAVASEPQDFVSPIQTDVPTW